MKVLFKFDGQTYTREEMRAANGHDGDLADWLETAEPGDVFGGGSGVPCTCISAEPTPQMTTMEIARAHATELRASLILLNGQADAVSGLLLQQLIAQAAVLDDALEALDMAQADTRAAKPTPAMPALPPAKDLWFGDWPLPTSKIN